MKRTLFYIGVAMCVAVVTLSSCREDEVDIQSPFEESAMEYDYPSEQFQAIWQSMVTCYGMWGIDETDWEGVYKKMYPQFKELDEQSKTGYVSTEKMQALYYEAFSTIRDHHLYLTVVNKWAAEEEPFGVYPGLLEVYNRSYAHASYQNSSMEYDDLKEMPIVQYLSGLEDRGRVSDLNYAQYESNGQTITVVSAVIDGTIPYLYLSHFDIGSLTEEEIYNAYPDATFAFGNFNDNVLSLPTVDGVIIDLRENGGGSLDDQQFLLGLLVDYPVQVGWIRYKEGLGRYDYTPWVPFKFTPNENEDGDECRANYTNPIVVLCDMYSASMAEMTTIAVKNLPNGCVIGERTFGAHGFVSNSSDVYYSGTFGSPTGSHYCFMSDHTLKTVDGEVLEGIGVTPDIEMTFNVDEVTHGNDTWVDRAISYIQTGK